MKLKILFIIIILAGTLSPVLLRDQQLRPGFDKAEYREMLLISAATMSTPALPSSSLLMTIITGSFRGRTREFSNTNCIMHTSIFSTITIPGKNKRIFK